MKTLLFVIATVAILIATPVVLTFLILTYSYARHRLRNYHIARSVPGDVRLQWRRDGIAKRGELGYDRRMRRHHAIMRHFHCRELMYLLVAAVATIISGFGYALFYISIRDDQPLLLLGTIVCSGVALALPTYWTLRDADRKRRRFARLTRLD